MGAFVLSMVAFDIFGGKLSSSSSWVIAHTALLYHNILLLLLLHSHMQGYTLILLVLHFGLLVLVPSEGVWAIDGGLLFDT